MKSLGAIVVGIGNYRYDSQQFPLLRFAANDADEITKYLTACWAKPTEATIIRIADELATAEAIADAFTRLGRDGPYDLQLVFLSGHALTDSLRTAFVTQPVNGSSALDVIDDARLDQLLFSVPAKQTILILDCCHAEGITRGMSFFRTLEESDAHLFIASSREQQRTWEDERIGHGIFTAHLLDLLKTGSSVKLNGVRDQLDVDSELFPVLCDQVPLYVLEHKQQRQEPVKGGVSVRSVTLPVVRAARRIRSRTALGTAIRRLRQIALGTAVLATVFLGFVYTLAYYAQADRNGDIYLRHGTKWLAPVFRLFPTVRSDTGISSNDLSGDPANRYAIQAGETFGFWTHMSRQGYRDWYENIRSGLDPKATARYDVLVATGTTRPVYRLNDESRPSEVSFAAWALLDNSDSNQIKTLFSHLLGADRTSPLLTPFSANDLDFNILDRTQHDLSEFADALRATATVDPDRTFIAYLGFLKANQIWLAHSSTEQHGNEAQRRAADDVADVFAVIARARADRGGPPVDSEMSSALNKLAELGYGDLVHLALSRVAASPSEKNAAALQALSAFHGNSAEPDEAAAIRRLKDSLDSTVSSQAIVEKAYRRFVSVGGPEQSDLSGFLIAAADKRALPTSVLTILLDKAQITVTRHDSDFIDSEHARILAHAMSQVQNLRARLYINLLIL